MSVLCLYSKVSTKVNARSHILHLTVFRNQFGYRFKYRPIIRVDVQDLVCKDSAATALYMREKMQFGVGVVVSRDIGLHSVFFIGAAGRSLGTILRPSGSGDVLLQLSVFWAISATNCHRERKCADTIGTVPVPLVTNRPKP